MGTPAELVVPYSRNDLDTQLAGHLGSASG